MLVSYQPLGLPADNGLAAIDTVAGNTGVTGLWVLQMRGGSLPGAQVATGEVLVGTAGTDRLTGGGQDDFLSERAGNDILIGLEGRDTLEGGDGNDTLDGGPGDDFSMAGRRRRTCAT